MSKHDVCDCRPDPPSLRYAELMETKARNRRDCMIDKRDKLKNEAPFSCKLTKDCKAFIYYNAKLIYTACGKDYTLLRDALEKNDDFLAQQVMAKMTGNFKHGNERANKRR